LLLAAMHDLAAIAVEVTNPFGVVAKKRQQIALATQLLRTNPDQYPVTIGLVTLDAEPGARLGIAGSKQLLLDVVAHPIGLALVLACHFHFL
jgi:hypothetical protein